MNIHKKSKSLKKYKRRINHCKHCEAVYKSKAVRDDHVLKKHPEFIASVTSKIHRCEICTYKTTIKVELDRHMLKHPDVKSNYKLKLNTCLHCKATFKSKATMDDHIIRKHPECMESVTSKVHECKVCAFKTTNKRQFENHMLKHPEENSGLKMSTCSHCSAEFKSKRGLDNHTLSSHPVLEHSGEKYTCIHCNAAFKSKRTRDGHVAKKHPKFIASVASKIHECGLCTYKTTHKSHFNNHMVKHSGQAARSKVIHCKHCNAVYKSKQIIDDHVLKKHPEFIASVKSKIHECGLCTYKTTIKLELDRHMLKHPETESGCEKYTCSHCSAAFKSKRWLDDHVLKKHPKFSKLVTRKIHECEVCMYKAINKSNLKRHMLKHS
nr:unnamed protein product [Callosobruchus chinensis]